MADQYKIVEAQYQIAGGVGGHDLLVVEDQNGNIIKELDGLATSSDGTIKPIGYLPSDKLNVYESSSAYLYSASEPQTTLYTGSYSDVMNKWSAAENCATAINSKDISYPLMGLGANSNSVASTLDQCMGLIEQNISGGAYLTPGVGTILLDQNTINTIQQNHNIFPTGVPASEVLESETVATNSDGSITTTTYYLDGSKDVESNSGAFQETTYSSSGAISATEMVMTTPSGVVSAIIGGTGTVAVLNNAAITLTTGAQATLTGTNDQIVQTSASLTINGTATGDSITVSGTGNVDTVSGSTLIAETIGAGLTLTGTGNSYIPQAGSDTLTIMGTATGDAIRVNGTGNIDSVSGSGFIYEFAGAGLTLTGTKEYIVQEGNTTLTIAGTATNDAVFVFNKDNIDTVSGSYGIAIGNSGELVLTGTNDALSMQQGDAALTITGTAAGDTLTASGTGDTATVSGATLIAETTGAGLTLTGTNDSNITQAGSDTMTITGTATDDKITVSGTGNVDTVTGAESISLNANASDSIFGSYDPISGAGQNTLSINGTYDPVSDSNSTVNYTGSNTGDVVTGVGDNGGDWAGGGGGPTGGPTGWTSSSGYAGKQSAVTSAVGSHLSAVVQYDLNHGELAAAATAEAQYNAFEQSLTTPEQLGVAAVVLNGAKWNQPVITWSLADNPGTQSAPFSSYMTSDYETTVQEAFDTWAALMPGVTFEEVSDSAQSDIRLGFGDLNSPDTSLIGSTTFLNNNGQMLPDSIIRLEDPTQDPLITGTNEQLIYAGTDATLLQVLTHEIGHTLGLADNADPNSIMYYALTSNNSTPDSTDLAGINSLYGTGSTASASSSTSLNQLIQAMATFDTSSGAASTSLVPTAFLTNSITLAPPVNAH